MTEPLTITVAIMTFVLAFYIAYAVRPRRPELDGERWFKIILATLYRGISDSKGATLEEWERAVDRSVFYHPQGRFADLKVEQTTAFHGERAHLPGEQALVEHLASLESHLDRWNWLFVQSESGRLARFSDPEELGPQYRPATWMGSDVDWDAVAQAGIVAGAPWSKWLTKSDTKWLVLTDASLSDAHEAWGTALGDELGATAQLFDLVSEGQTYEQLGQRLLASSTQMSDRFVLVGVGRGAVLALRALADEPVLRDRTLAVVSIGGTLSGYDEHPVWGREAVTRWTEEFFNFVGLDTEMDRETAYFSVGLWDQETSPAGLPNLSLSEMRFPTIMDERAPVEGVHTVDLGLTRACEDEAYELLVRALWLTVTCWIRARVIT